MLTLTLTPLFTPRLSNFSTVNPFKLQETKKKKKKVKKARCRADLSGDAPFAVAIGACMLSSLLLPNGNDPDEESGTVYSGLDSTDTRLAAMGVISFIPYFNWLSWVFAWLDTGKRRYAVYALVYLAPYLRSNLSLSPEESWLPIASIVAGIIHVQLEASIRNGDIQGFQLFSEASKLFSKAKRDTDLEGHYGTPMEGGREEHRNLLPTEDQSRKEVEEREVPRTPSERSDTSNSDWYDDDGGGGRRH